MISAFGREIEIQGKTFIDEVDEGYRVQSHKNQTVYVDTYPFSSRKNYLFRLFTGSQVTLRLIPPGSPAVAKHDTNNGIPRSTQLNSKGRRYPYPEIEYNTYNGPQSTKPPICVPVVITPVHNGLDKYRKNGCTNGSTNG